jgi:hypothetical protein
MRGKVKDASWLIGPLLLIPALLYLSWWNSTTGEFHKHARRTTATIAPYMWGLPKAERSRLRVAYTTYIEFADEQGHKVLGYRRGASGPEDR